MSSVLPSNLGKTAKTSCEVIATDICGPYYRHGQPWTTHTGKDISVDRAAIRLVPTDILEELTPLAVIANLVYKIYCLCVSC